jgi:hypothetical protein
MGCVCALGLTEACADVQRLLDLGDPPTSCDASLADIQLGIVESGAADLPLACRQKP